VTIFPRWLCFVCGFCGVCWWPTASGSERIPAIYQSYLMKLSPCMWYMKSNGTVELGLLITNYSLGALKSHFICVCGDYEFNLIKKNKIQKRVGLTASLLSNTWTADGLLQYLWTCGVHMDESPRITWNQKPKGHSKTKPKLIAIEPTLIAIPFISYCII